MTLSLFEQEFIRVAVAAAPRVAELIAAYPAEHRSGALSAAERRYMQAAQDFGCTDQDARTWVGLVMRNVRKRVEHQHYTATETQPVQIQLCAPA